MRWIRYWREMREYRRLLVEGQRLASQRERLRDQGVPEAHLLNPLAPIKPRRPR